MIDHRLGASTRKDLAAAAIDPGNAYLGPDGAGGVVAWPPAVAEALGVTPLGEIFEAVVEAPVEPLREQPAHRSGQLSEVRQGEFLVVIREEGDWWVAAGEDGYVGWVRSWGARRVDSREKQDLLDRCAGVLAPAVGRLEAEDGAAPVLLGGTPLLHPPGDSPGILELVDGTRGRLPFEQVEIAPPRPSPAALARWAARMVGVSYRWGGRSLAGMDCSGLVQWAALRAGYELPRDAIQQAGCGIALAREGSAWQKGDLLFFGDPIAHVGIYDGEEGLLHARARVRHQPLGELGDLMDDLVAVRRLHAAEAVTSRTLWRRPFRA